MPCSHVSEFQNLSLAVFTCLRQRLGLSNERLCTSAKTLPARGYPGHDALPRFYEFFQKIPTIVSRPIARAKGFFDGNVGLRGQMTACVERRAAVRSKLLVLMPQRLQHEDLRVLSEFPGLHPICFQKYLSDRWNSGLKKRFHKQNLDKLPPKPSEFSGAANKWLYLADSGGQAFRLLHLCGSRVRLSHFGFLRSTPCCCSRLEHSEAIKE
jgi:hypothetical protein